MNGQKTIYDVKSTFNSEKSRHQYTISKSVFNSNKPATTSTIHQNLLQNKLKTHIKEILNTRCSFPHCDNKISTIYSTCCKKHNFYVPPKII